MRDNLFTWACLCAWQRQSNDDQCHLFSSHQQIPLPVAPTWSTFIQDDIIHVRNANNKACKRAQRGPYCQRLPIKYRVEIHINNHNWHMSCEQVAKTSNVSPEWDRRPRCQRFCQEKIASPVWRECFSVSSGQIGWHWSRVKREREVTTNNNFLHWLVGQLAPFTTIVYWFASTIVCQD